MSDLVGNPKDRFSHDVALIVFGFSVSLAELHKAARDFKVYGSFYQGSQ